MGLRFDSTIYLRSCLGLVGTLSFALFCFACWSFLLYKAMWMFLIGGLVCMVGKRKGGVREGEVLKAELFNCKIQF